MTKRKGQGGEMIGLVVIVLLLVVIFMVYIRMSSAPKLTTDDTRKGIENNNLVNSILNANLCPGKSMEDAIKAWGNGISVCSKDNMEDFIKQEAEVMLRGYYGAKYDLKQFELTINPISEEKDDIVLPTNLGAQGLSCKTGEGIIASDPKNIGFPVVAVIQIKTCLAIA
ncbi:MAG: hypothetical protein WC852_00605 [Candidatus Nanoarchaeia archaeon]|jgi:hypothetical protein